MTLKVPSRVKGFTLIELMVFISIIGFMSSVVLTSVKAGREKATDTRRISDIHQIQTALELYRQDHNSYPFSSSWLLATDGSGYYWASFGGVQDTSSS